MRLLAQFLLGLSQLLHLQTQLLHFLLPRGVRLGRVCRTTLEALCDGHTAGGEDEPTHEGSPDTDHHAA